MDRFRDLATFLAVAEAGAFNAAARKLGTSAPSVTRIIGEMEARLGAKLFLRSTRAVVLTDAGARLLPEARRLLDDLAAAEATASGAEAAIRGEIRITAPVLFGQIHLAPLMRDFLDTHPETRVTALLLDRVVNLMEEGIDIALRIAELPDSGLTAIRVGTVRQVVVAAPALLNGLAAPESLKDLADLPVIGAGAPEAAGVWRFHRAGRTTTIRLAPRLLLTSNAAAIEAAEAGWGIARVRYYQVAAALEAGRLVELLPGADDREIPVSLVHREGPAAGARTRAFLDFAVPRLRDTLRAQSCRTASPQPSARPGQG